MDILAQAEDVAFGMSREEALEVCREVTTLVRMVLRGLDRGNNGVEREILDGMLGPEVEKKLREEKERREKATRLLKQLREQASEKFKRGEKLTWEEFRLLSN